MVMTTTSSHKATSEAVINRRRWKYVLWGVMGAMTTSVILYSEIPLLIRERAYLGTMPFLIVLHVLGGVVALCSGPLQFSRRLRKGYPKLHRVLGRAYVVSVFIAAPLAIPLVIHKHDPRAKYFFVAIIVQAGAWIISTAAAFLTARNRQFQQHREWMVRSYAITFTFVGTRVLQPIPAWNHFSDASFAMTIIIITFIAILISDIALHWNQLTSRRV
jgi:uncharacterized membrane protein YozB (DUF420 family)